MPKNIQFFILVLIIIATIYPEIRISGTGLVFPNISEIVLVGLPRLIEILAIIFVVTYIFRGNSYLSIPFFIPGIFLLLILFVFTLFKPLYAQYFRTSFLIPIFIFYTIFKNRFSTPMCLKLLLVLNFVIFLSSAIVLSSTYFNYSWVQNIDLENGVKRYIGLGQSAPYQSFYMLLGVSLNLFFISLIPKQKEIFWLLILIEILAIILVGARTGYMVLSLLFAYYFFFVIKIQILFSLKSLLIISSIFIIGYYFLWDHVSPTFDQRNDFNTLSSRDIVWQIALKLILLNPIFGINDFFSAAKELGLKPPAHSQNGYFEIIFWGGIITFMLYLNFFFKIFYFINKYSRKPNIVLLTMLVINYAFFNISEILYASVQVQITFFLILGLLTNLSLNYSSEIKHEKKNNRINKRRFRKPNVLLRGSKTFGN